MRPSKMIPIVLILLCTALVTSVAITDHPMTLVLNGGRTPTPTEEPSNVQKPYAAHTVPGRINFVDFDYGGKGVAYHDTEAGNQGGYAYRTDDVDADTGLADLAYVEFAPVAPTPTSTPAPTPGNEMYGADVNPTGNPIGGGNGYTDIISRNDPRVKYIVDMRIELLSALQNARSREYGADANPTGNPIGGGNGYTDIISRNDPRVKYIVDTRDELLSALQNARSRDVIYVEGTANIDMSGYFNIQVPAGVTIASNRGENGAAGGRVYQNRLPNDDPAWSLRPLFATKGEGVRFTGLRIEGPDKGEDVSEFRSGIYTGYQLLEIDNCEMWGWGGAAIVFWGTGGVEDMKDGGYVHHNYIHHCQGFGLGYGVVVYRGSVCLVEANYLNYCSHTISGDGVAGDGYEARYNINGPNATHQNFDMHGKPNPSGSGKIAGDLIKIHHNTFLGTEPVAAFPIAIRGVPRVGAYIDHNWFYYSSYAPVWQMNGEGNIYVTDNLIGQERTLYPSGPIEYSSWSDY